MLARVHARPFRKDEDRPALGRGLACRPQHMPQRARAAFAIHRNDAIASRHAAPAGDIGKLALQHHGRLVQQKEHFDRLEHRLMLRCDQSGASRGRSFDARPDSEDVARAQTVPSRPAERETEERPPPDQGGRQSEENRDHASAVEEECEQEGSQPGHQIPTTTAARRKRYLLYSVKSVAKRGLDCTASP